MSVSQPYSLTPEQERLWIEWKLYPVSAAYNNHLIYKLRGQINTEKLLSSIKKAAADDIFHLIFDEIAGKAYQKKLTHPEIEVAHLESPTLETSYHIINDFIKTPFDLKRPFPYRFFLIKQFSDNFYYLGFVMHHILMDGQSTNLFLQKIVHYYNKGAILHHALLDFTDYLKELPTLLNEKLSDNEHYWQNKLTKGLPSVDLLHTFSTKKISAQHKLIIPSEIKKALKTLAFQQKSTLFLLLMTACKVLMYRYFNCKQLTFFYPVNIRPNNYKNVMGFFVNTLPMVTKREEKITFLDLLKNITKQRKEDKQHQTISLLTLFNLLRSRGESINSHDYIIFSHVRFFKNILALDHIIAEEITTDFYYEAMTHLSFLYDDEGEEIHFLIEYNQALFEDWFIVQMGKHLNCLLESIIKNPYQAVDLLDFMRKPQEQKENSFTNLSLSPCIFVQQTIEQHARYIPNKTAIREGALSITYGELNRKANQFAYYLLEQGIKPRDFVGILANRSINTLIALLAILKLGAIYVPIDPRYPKQRQEIILKASDCKHLLILDDSENLANLIYPIPTINQQQLVAALEKGKDDNLDISSLPDDVMYVIYTSGTTGVPKGIPITYRNLSTLFTTTELLFNFNTDDVWTLFHSLAFDFSVWEWCGALLYGGTLIIVPYAISRSPQAFYHLVVNEKVTVLNQTPSAFYEFIEADKQNALPLALRTIIFGGEKLEYRRLHDWFENHDEHYPQLINMYGITEGTIHVTFHPITKSELDNPESNIGQSLSHMKTYVLDANKQIMPFGCIGELYISGLALTLGYLNQADETAKRFLLNPYSNDPDLKWLYETGDKVKMLPNGDLIYLDRIDTQINFRGFRIELAEIEHQLDKLPQIKRSVVTLNNKIVNFPQLTAYLALKPHMHPTPFELRQSLLEVLPTYMVPTQFFQIDTIPLTINGKVDYNALSQLETHVLCNITPAPNELSILKCITEIWKNSLSLDKINIHKNFFDIGGDSLLLVKIHAELEQTFHYSFPPAVLFSYPTIASLAEYFSKMTSFQKTPLSHVFTAKKMLDSTKFDLVISDIGLPDGTGFDIITSIKKNQLSINYLTPFVALTAHSDERKKSQIKEYGFLHILQKPLTAETATHLINTYSLNISETPSGISTLDKNNVIIDLQTTMNLMSNDKETALEMLELLSQNIQEEKLLIQQAYQKNDILDTRSLLHKLRGGLSYYGVPKLKKSANELHEEVRKIKQLSSIEHLYHSFYKEYR